MADVDSTGIWQHWIKQLIDAVTSGGLGEGQQFSAGSTTLSVDLANADPQISAFNIFEIGDTVPAASPTYAPGSGLATSYSLFLNFVDLGGSVDPNIQSQLNLAAEAVSQAQSNFVTQQNTAYTNFASYKKNIDPNAIFDTWVAANYPVYLAAKNALTGAQSQYDQLAIQAYGAGYQALAAAQSSVGYTAGAQSIATQNAFNMAVKTGTVAPVGSGPAVLPGQFPPPPADNMFSSFRPAYQLDSSFPTRFAEWQRASTAGGPPGASISVSSTSQTLSWSEFGWNASLSADVVADFWSVGVAGSTKGEKTSIDTTSKDFSLEVDFVGLGSFAINPGGWWANGSLVSNYRDKLKSGAPDFFGPNGSLARRPYEAVIGFEPTVKLSLDSQDYQDAKTTWQASATLSVGIGPFRLGSATVNTNGGKENMTYDDASATVTIGPLKSSVPILLGVISQQLG